MLRHLALPTLRARWTAYVGVLVSIVTAVIVMTVRGVLLASGISGGVPPERYVGADLVVSRHQAVSERHGHGDDAETIHTGVVERLRLPSDIVARLAATPGVAAAVADVSFSAVVLDATGEPLAGVDGGDSLGHAWSSAEVTPFALVSGHAPDAHGRGGPGRRARLPAAHLSAGDAVHLVVGGRPVDGVLVGTAHPDQPTPVAVRRVLHGCAGDGLLRTPRTARRRPARTSSPARTCAPSPRIWPTSSVTTTPCSPATVGERRASRERRRQHAPIAISGSLLASPCASRSSWSRACSAC